MTVRKYSGFGIAASLMCLMMTGCANDILDPTQIGRFRPVPVVNVILENLGVADEPDSSYAGAEEPRPEDLVTYEQDYRFSTGDVVRISIYELLREGFPFVNDYVVTETGRISIPDIGPVLAMGLTERELEVEISNRLKDGGFLLNPSVTVILLESQSRFFSIYGAGITRSGRYPIPRYDYRLTDAIALAGDVGQYNVTSMFVSREVPVESSTSPITVPPAAGSPVSKPGKAASDPIKVKSVEPAQPTANPQEELMDVIQPFTQSGPSSPVGTPSVAPDATLQAAELTGPNAVSKGGDSNAIEWVFENGQWKPVRALPSDQTPKPSTPASASAQQVYSGKQTVTRVIKIPVDRLKGGDPRYDIVIRPGDRISVPVDVIGEYWVMGNVNRVGPLNITGRPMTLKMAIATAGGLNELAWPKKVEVIRRIGRNKAGLMQEETVMVDLDKIAKGQQPDFFIKQYDLINVGTHGASRFLAVLRNAFRASYGFGLIYDRNFATSDFGDQPLPKSFGQIF
jgi:polysaccharide biosynthesis/export protein